MSNIRIFAITPKNMSKLSQKPIILPEGVTAAIEGGSVIFEGKLGTVAVPLLPYIGVEIQDRQIVSRRLEEHKQARANWGTVSALMRNAIQGVSAGFEKRLELEGIGFRVSLEGGTLVLNVGFTHPVRFSPPPGIAVSVEKNTIIVRGVNRELVGETAASIRKIKKPEPYQGKGIRYAGEAIRRKEGKKAATAAKTT